MAHGLIHKQRVRLLGLLLLLLLLKELWIRPRAVVSFGLGMGELLSSTFGCLQRVAQ